MTEVSKSSAHTLARSPYLLEIIKEKVSKALTSWNYYKFRCVKVRKKGRA